MRWPACTCLLFLLCLGCSDDQSPEPEPDDSKDAGWRDGGGSIFAKPDAAVGNAGAARDAGMGSPELTLGAGLGAARERSAWTVLIYGHADHNLSNSFLRDLVEMAKAQINPDVQVIVLADFDASQELANSDEHFPSGAVWMRISGGSMEPETLATERELNLDDPEVLSAVVAAGFSEFPSQHRALIMWDHGGSWNGGYGCDSQNGTLDAETCRRLTANEVATSVASGLQNADAGALDIFSFDTCLMAGAEVAWEFKDLARVYIANAEIDYGDGWDYTAFLSYLSQHPDTPLRELASQEVRQWNAHHEKAGFNDAFLRSHVALDTSALPRFGQAMDQFVKDWKASKTLSGIELGRANYFSLPPYQNELDNPNSQPELRDLGLFLDKMIAVSDSTVSASAKAARSALEATIIGRSQGSLREKARQLGVHIELPLAATMSDALMGEYNSRAANWIKASHWSDALDTYAGLADSTEPTITASISNADDPDAANLPTIEFSIQDPDVAEAEVYLATLDREAGELILFGIVAKNAIDVSDTYHFAWDGRLTTLIDSSDNQQAIEVGIWEDVGVDASGSSNAPVLAIYGIFSGPYGEQLSALLFQDGDEQVGILTTLDPPATLLLSEIASDAPGSTFTPLYESVSLETEKEGTQLGDAIPLDSASLRLSRASAAAGSYALVTLASDVYGNTGVDAQVATVQTPIQP